LLLVVLLLGRHHLAVAVFVVLVDLLVAGVVVLLLVASVVVLFLLGSLVEFLPNKEEIVRKERRWCVEEVGILTGLMRTIRLSWSRRNWAKKLTSPSNSFKRPSILLFSISIMKLSGPWMR